MISKKTDFHAEIDPHKWYITNNICTMSDSNIFYTYPMVIHIICWHLFVFLLTKIQKIEFTCIFHQTVRKSWICIRLQWDHSERSQIRWQWAWVFRNREILLTINIISFGIIFPWWTVVDKNPQFVKTKICQHIWPNIISWNKKYYLSALL